MGVGIKNVIIPDCYRYEYEFPEDVNSKLQDIIKKLPVRKRKGRRQKALQKAIVHWLTFTVKLAVDMSEEEEFSLLEKLIVKPFKIGEEGDVRGHMPSVYSNHGPIFLSGYVVGAWHSGYRNKKDRTVCVEMYGKAFDYLRESKRYMAKAKSIIAKQVKKCEEYSARYTRLDIALDDFHGNYFTLEKMTEAIKLGTICQRGNGVKENFQHSLKTEGRNGKTQAWSISTGGRRNNGDKHTKGYQKGEKTRSRKYPSWVRLETSYHPKPSKKLITQEMILNPSDALTQTHRTLFDELKIKLDTNDIDSKMETVRPQADEEENLVLRKIVFAGVSYGSYFRELRKLGIPYKMIVEMVIAGDETGNPEKNFAQWNTSKKEKSQVIREYCTEEIIKAAERRRANALKGGTNRLSSLHKLINSEKRGRH